MKTSKYEFEGLRRIHSEIQVRVRKPGGEWRWRKFTPHGYEGQLDVFLQECLKDTRKKQTSKWPESQDLAAAQVLIEMSAKGRTN